MLNLRISESRPLKRYLLQVPHLVWLLIHLQILLILLLSKVCVFCPEQVFWCLLLQRQIHGISVGRDHCKTLFFLLRVHVQDSVMQICTSLKGPHAPAW